MQIDQIVQIGSGRLNSQAINNSGVTADGLVGDGRENVTVGSDAEARRERGAERMVIGDVQGRVVLVRGRKGVHGGREVP